jgi:hypothetical protein
MVLAATAAVGALAWWQSARGPGEPAFRLAPGSESHPRASGAEASAPPVEPRPPVASDADVPAPAETSPEAPTPIGPMRLEEDQPESPGGGAVREPEAPATVPSGSALRRPETGPPPDDGRPLRGPETPLPGLPAAADPAMLPSRAPEDQGATSTR